MNHPSMNNTSGCINCDHDNHEHVGIIDAARDKDKVADVKQVPSTITVQPHVSAVFIEEFNYLIDKLFSKGSTHHLTRHFQKYKLCTKVYNITN